MSIEECSNDNECGGKRSVRILSQKKKIQIMEHSAQNEIHVIEILSHTSL